MPKLKRMAKVKVTRDGWRCERCGHEWIPKSMARTPKVCPHCRSPYWDRPRRNKR